MSVIINGDTGITTPAETVQGALTTTGNTILGDASTDTLNVGNGGLVKDASGNVGIGTASPGAKLDVGTTSTSHSIKLNGTAATFNINGTSFGQIASETTLYVDTNTAVPIVFRPNGTERMRIDSTGASTFTGTGKFATTIGVGNATPAASGSGITFPATQSASSDANTLDDYEEGTWTPTFSSLTVVGTPTYAGFYTKIGRLVYVQISISSTTSTASTANTTNVTNLPFSATGIAVGNATNSSVGNYGVAYIGAVLLYPPSWAATNLPVYISGVFYTT